MWEGCLDEVLDNCPKLGLLRTSAMRPCSRKPATYSCHDVRASQLRMTAHDCVVTQGSSPSASSPHFLFFLDSPMFPAASWWSSGPSLPVLPAPKSEDLGLGEEMFPTHRFPCVANAENASRHHNMMSTQWPVWRGHGCTEVPRLNSWLHLEALLHILDLAFHLFCPKAQLRHEAVGV